ncbi:MAG TPA: methyltransferase domain-containing protein [Pyrinomonadaceae bacterium]|jgi:predicted methyltransferase
MRREFTSLLLRSALLLASAFAALGCAIVAPQTRRAPHASPTPAANASATPAPRAPEAENINRSTSEPYAGDLSIFETPDRDRKLQIERVMDTLGIKAGSAVADIGAGSGWFTVRAARRVGEAGTVYAVEINKDYIRHIEERAAREKLPNIRTVLGREDDPLLPERSVDAVLILKTYHEIGQPIRVLASLRRSMRAGARLGIIDRNGKGDDHGIDRATVVREAERAGFALVEEHDFVKPDNMDYFLVFQVRN